MTALAALPLAPLLAKAEPIHYPELALRLGIDVVAIGILTHLLFLRRHGRRDLRDTFVILNVCVFAALSVIGSQKISAGVAFGLFAVLSIIRLRSEPYDNIEIAYFFGSLTLALVNGFAQGPVVLSVVLDAVILVAVFVIDHKTLRTQTVKRRKVTLDSVETDVDKLAAMLSERMGVEIVGVTVNEVDYVRGTTSLSVRFLGNGQHQPPAPAAG